VDTWVSGSGGLQAGRRFLKLVRTHVGEGRSREVLDALERLGRDFASVRRVFSGHYAPAAIAPLIPQSDGGLRILEHFRWRTRRGSGTNVFESDAAQGPYGDFGGV